MTSRSASAQASAWPLHLTCAGLLAITLHLLIVAFGRSEATSFAFADLPLLLLLALVGPLLVLRIVASALSGEAGADLLAALALVTATVMGEYLAATLIAVMLSGGQALEEHAMRRASSALAALAQRMPAKAHRRRQGAMEEVPLAELQAGDEVVVPPHAVAPVDGVVIEGHGSMDESYLTGEPYGVSKAPGSAVLSGAVNGNGALVIRATQRPEDSRYARIMEVMQEAEQRRPRLRRLGDRLGALFAPVALLIALATWWLSGDATRFLAVLVVATPCPLLIAIPITLVSAISMAARRGIVVRDPTVLERLPTCRTAIFDKTGTLTLGRPQLTAVLVAGEHQPDRILELAASLEGYSKHPLASAVMEAARARALALPQVSEVSEAPGAGLTGVVDGQRIVITHRSRLERESPALAAQLPPPAPGLECVVLVDGELGATLRFRDKPRHEGQAFIRHLGPAHQFGRVMLLSGDRETEVQYLAGLLGIDDALASRSPEQKLHIVTEATREAPTLFVGDGVNDAPAMAAATVGIAFGQNSPVTAEAAGAVIMEGSLQALDELLHLSVAMRRIVLQSAVGGMLLSLVAMGFAAMGYIEPVFGALLQEVIDLLAIGNALRLTRAGGLATDMQSAAAMSPPVA
jgi:heavy metal translocating P-type ATPase